MDALPYATLGSISYHVASNPKTTSYSAARVTTPTIDVGNPSDGSLYDLRMGVNNDTIECRTCMHLQKLCQKHYGIIPLAVPMVNPLTDIFSELLRWLCFKCTYCSGSVVDPTKLPGWNRVAPLGRLKFTAAHLKILKVTDKTLSNHKIEKVDKIPSCLKCGKQHPLIMVRTTKERSQIFMFPIDLALSKGRFHIDQAVVMTPVLINEIACRVGSDEVRLFGHDPLNYHPRNFVKTCIEVLPVNLRSSQIMLGNAKPQMDALTKTLSGIIKCNSDIEPHRHEFSEKVNAVLSSQPALDVLQNHKMLYENKKDKGRLASVNFLANLYYKYITGKSTAAEANSFGDQHGGEAESSFAQLFHGKKGFIRKDGLGSRNHNRSRMVIYNEPFLKIDEVLLSLFALMRLRRRSVVTPQNYVEMRRYLLNGPNVYPGAFSVRRSDGTTFSVEKINPETFDLRIGDILERMILEGEWITINRQPSTLLTNICAHRVRVDPNMNHYAMGLNVEVCGLYNADFDGDQMTVYALKDIGAIVETQELTNVRNHFISDQKSIPNWGLSQDARTMIAELTRSSVILSRAEAMMLNEHVTKSVIFDKPTYTGRELISLVLPKINYRQKNAFGSDPKTVELLGIKPDEIEVVVKDGIVLSGVFDTKIVSPTKNSIFDVIFARYGVEVTIDAIYNLQQLALAYSRIAIFTIGPRDFIINDDAAIQKIHQVVGKTLLDAEPVITSFQNGLLTAPADRTVEDYFEAKMVNELSQIQPKEAVFGALPDSSLIKMVLYGSRGNLTNLFNITACVGQTLIDGKRIKRTFDYKRTNIYQQRGDLSPEACGFVPDPYYVGLRPDAYFMNSQEARSNIIKKALATSIAGAMCRLMVRNTESMNVNYWHGVMCNKRVVEWIFGDNNFDPGRVFEYNIPMMGLDDATFESMLTASIPAATLKASVTNAHQPKTSLDRLLAACREDRQLFRANNLDLQYMSGAAYFPLSSRFPLNILELGEFDPAPIKGLTEAAMLDRLRSVEELCAWFPRSTFNNNVSLDQLPRHYFHTYRFMQMYVHACLTWHNVSRLTDDAWLWLMGLIRTKFLNALIQPGEAAGIKASTAVSEPVTQKQLDSSHTTGNDRLVGYSLTDTNNHIQAKDITAMGHGKMWMRLVPALENDLAAAERIANTIQVINLREFMEQLQLFHENFGVITHPDFRDEEAVYHNFLRDNLHRPDNKGSGSTISKYCVRIQLNRRQMLAKNISVIDIVEQLYRHHEDIYIVHNHMNDSRPLIIRVHIMQRAMKRIVKEFSLLKLIEYSKKLLDTPVRGVEGIIEAFVYPSTEHIIGPDGALGKREIYMIRTRGSNLLGMAGIPGIVPESIETNAMRETNRIFGMSVTRAKIIQEWCKILPGFVASYFIFLADVMLSTAKITALNRNGNMLREPNNVLLNMGTGGAVRVVMKASINDISNPMYGLSGPLLGGQTITHGTGSVKMAYDPVFLRANRGIQVNNLLEAL